MARRRSDEGGDVISKRKDNTDIMEAEGQTRGGDAATKDIQKDDQHIENGEYLKRDNRCEDRLVWRDERNGEKKKRNSGLIVYQG